MSDLALDIKASVYAIFEDPSRMASFASRQGSSGATTQLADLLEAAPVNALAAKLAQIVRGLTDADPERIATAPTWLQRFTGASVEMQVRYHVARKQIEGLIAEAETAAGAVRRAVAVMDVLLIEHQDEADNLRAHVEAGQQYLLENPDAGTPAAGALQFENTRERFARRLANLATLLASHEMSVTQMKLTRAQATDMLDRFEETSRMLVPVWRQHTLALTTTKNMSPAMVAEATQAHRALMRSLVQSMQT